MKVQIHIFKKKIYLLSLIRVLCKLAMLQRSFICLHGRLKLCTDTVNSLLLFSLAGVGDPERMAPPRVEEYVNSVLSSLKKEVISDLNVLQEDYPLFAAVNRAANQVSRHRGRIIFLEYVPPQPARKTLMLVGKGVTYDTGGADIKAGGVMAGMSRDKCGAAAVAGFMQVTKTHYIYILFYGKMLTKLLYTDCQRAKACRCACLRCTLHGTQFRG